MSNQIFRVLARWLTVLLIVEARIAGQTGNDDVVAVEARWG